MRQKEIVPLQIGDKIPNKLWEICIPTLPKENTTKLKYIKLGDFKESLILLEFFWEGFPIPMTCPHQMENIKRNINNSFVGYVLSDKEKNETIYHHYKNMSTPILIDHKNLRSYFSNKSSAFQVYIFDKQLQVIAGIEGSHATPKFMELIGPILTNQNRNHENNR